MDLKFIVYLNSMVLISPSSSTPRVRLLQLPCRQVVLTRVSAAARFPRETPRLQGGFVVGRSRSFILIPGGLKGAELGLPYFDRRDGRTSAKGTCSGGSVSLCLTRHAVYPAIIWLTVPHLSCPLVFSLEPGETSVSRALIRGGCETVPPRMGHGASEPT